MDDSDDDKGWCGNDGGPDKNHMALKIYVHKGNNKNSDDEMHLFHVNSIIHPRQQFQLCAFELAKKHIMYVKKGLYMVQEVLR